LAKEDYQLMPQGQAASSSTGRSMQDVLQQYGLGD